MRSHFRSHRQLAPGITIRLSMRSLKRYRRFAHYRVATHQTGLVGQTETGVVQIALVGRKNLAEECIRREMYRTIERPEPDPLSGPC